MDQEHRADPDSLLAAVRREAARQDRGVLKVFLGMAAGVGKTYAMLEAARKAVADGRDVVVGYVETHGRQETEALMEGLARVPRQPVVHRGVTLTEMDLDAVLARRPQLAVVDELAHSNAPGSRHPKRYQDVQELIEAGIDVYSTLNVQHIASRADTVREITGVTVQETVPDSILDAAEIELVDLSPEDLLRRLDEGKVYVPEQAAVAVRSFFRQGNLSALRELSLRFAAERVGQDVRDYMQARQIPGPWKTGHRLLVAISPSPFSAPLVRWTRRLADSLHCGWIAAYVESPAPLTEADQTRLAHHMALARELGAEVRTTVDDNLVRGILRIAQTQNVTQIVVGKPGPHPWLLRRCSGLPLSRLIRASGKIDVHVVRAEGEKLDGTTALWQWPDRSQWHQCAAVLAAIGAVTALNWVGATVVGPRTVALVYLMGVIGLALRFGRGPVLLAAALSAVLWNVLFLPPRFTLYVRSVEDAMMFATYFVVALAMGHLITRVRTRERADRRREERATALYLLTLELADASGWSSLERAVVENVERVFRSKAALLLPTPQGGLSGTTSEKELSTAAWAFEHARPAGRFTDTLPAAEAMYIPLQTTGPVLGVLRIAWQQSFPPTLEQNALLEAFSRHIAIVIERQRLRDAEANARAMAESERLGRALLNSVSHALRTPLAAIQGAASGLTGQDLPSPQAALVAEIGAAAERLNRLVGSILDMTRVESGQVRPHLDWCDITDLVNVALTRTARDLAAHPVDVAVPEGLPLVRLDFTLIEQVLANLLRNAALHTPPGTAVRVSATARGSDLLLTVADRGPGIPSESLPHLFEKFYRAPGAPPGGTGLGLSIVKGFVEAHRGRVEAVNRPGGGASFTVVLPVEEAPAT